MNVMEMITNIGKLFLFLILLMNLVFFSVQEFRKRRKMILLVVFLFLLSVGALFSFLADLSELRMIELLWHVMGIGFVGITAMLISVSANKRMQKVMRHGIKLVHRRH